MSSIPNVTTHFGAVPPMQAVEGDMWMNDKGYIKVYQGGFWVMYFAYKETDELPITELTPVVETTPVVVLDHNPKAVDDKIDAFNGTLNLFPESSRLDEADNEIIEIEFQGKKMWINMEDYKA